MLIAKRSSDTWIDGRSIDLGVVIGHPSRYFSRYRALGLGCPERAREYREETRLQEKKLVREGRQPIEIRESKGKLIGRPSIWHWTLGQPPKRIHIPHTDRRSTNGDHRINQETEKTPIEIPARHQHQVKETKERKWYRTSWTSPPASCTAKCGLTGSAS